MNTHETVFFFGFILFVVSVLVIDLGFIGKKNHVIPFKEALIWTGVWVFFALILYVWIMFYGDRIHGIQNLEQLKAIIVLHGHPIKLTNETFAQALVIYRHNLSLEYITGYLIEYALSVDNVFVMIMIFIAFNVDQRYYKRVLFWGILGAIVLRFLFIFLSSALIQEFSWFLYVFGVLLVFTGVKMFLERNNEDKIETSKHPVVRFVSKLFPVYPNYVGKYFIIRKNRKSMITPLFIALLVIEFTDVVFAVDSVPAIFSITQDPYIVFFSNIFAILGLRSLFFVVMHVVNLFRFLKIGLAVLLTFIGLKMLLHTYLDALGFTTSYSLLIVLAILITSILASVLIPEKKTEG
jgi:tellurite resistance protein TerC